MDKIKYFKGKRVFVTGHTGFKGSWMCKILLELGAEVAGYALAPNTEPNLFSLLKLDKQINSTIGDIRDLGKLTAALNKFKPEVVIHMAAQPLVLEGYKDPVGTYSSNVMGTVHILEAVRGCKTVERFLNVTTDKVYKNLEWEWGYRETDVLDGYDPYSNSKSCSELVTATYARSFFKDSQISIATARAGNVIGGGDFADNRIIPDCVRATQEGQPVIVRNPKSVRPYQHVLEPVFAYLMLAAGNAKGEYNIGPEYGDCVPTGKLVDLFVKHWGGVAAWENRENKDAPHEAGFLRLDSSKIKKDFNWTQRWDINEAVKKSVEWYKAFTGKENLNTVTEKQIKEFLNEK